MKKSNAYAKCLTAALLFGSSLSGLAVAEESTKGNAYCAVEIGARGVKGRLYIFGPTTEKNMPSLEPKYSKDINTNLIGTMEGARFTDAGIESAADAVATMLSEMKTQQASCKAFVVGSSGIARAENREELAQRVAAKSGVATVEFVNAEQEAKFGFFGSIPRRMWESTTLVDIGSGNTKIGAIQGQDFKSVEIPFGAVSLTTKVNAAGTAFPQAVAAVLDAEARIPFRKATSQYPVILSRKNTVLIGGTIWATVTYALPDKGRRNFVKVGNSDLSNFRQALANGTWTKGKPSPFVGGGVKKTFAEDSKKVLEIFTRENLMAGHSILSMYLESRATDGPIYFARSGNWIFGYIQEKFSQEVWGQESIEEHL